MAHNIFTMPVARIYPLYVAKAVRKGHTKKEVDDIIYWLTDYSQSEFEALIVKQADFQTFFAEAPAMNPARSQIKGVICGVRVEEITDPLMREIRYLDKLVDDMAKGKSLPGTS